MLRGIRGRKTYFLRQDFDAALTLRELFQQLQPMRMGQAFRNSSELAEENLFGLCVDIRRPATLIIQVIN